MPSRQSGRTHSPQLLLTRPIVVLAVCTVIAGVGLALFMVSSLARLGGNAPGPTTDTNADGAVRAMVTQRDPALPVGDPSVGPTGCRGYDEAGRASASDPHPREVIP